jgi:hypothetical protein
MTTDATDLLPPLHRWATYFTIGATQYYVAMVTTDNPAVPGFEYGTRIGPVSLPIGAPGVTQTYTRLGALEAGSEWNAEGTIRLVLDLAKIGAPQAGTVLSGMSSVMRSSLPDQGDGIGLTEDSTAVVDYTLAGNAFCAPIVVNEPPVAALLTTGTSGTEPLTVTFDASGSTDPEGSALTYEFDFGDNSEHQGPGALATATHTYAALATPTSFYRARLIVRDAAGLQNINVADADITVQADADGDGVLDSADTCPGTHAGDDVNAAGCSTAQLDADGDGIADTADNCPNVPNASQADVDADGAGDACDSTDDRDLMPDAFTFVARSGVATGVYVTSESKTLTGFTLALPISVADGQYRINSGAWTSADGQVLPNDVIAVRHVSAATESTTVNTTVTVGTYSTTFSSTTSAVDRTPDPFSFGTKTGVDPGVLVESDVITPTGYNTGASIVAGTGIEYRIDGGTYTNANGTLQPGQTLQVRHVSSTTSGGYTKTSLKVGGVTGYFTTRTK